MPKIVEDDIFVLMGFGFLLAALFGKKFYYYYSNKPAPLWYGRSVAVLVGAGFMLFGFIDLFHLARSH